MKKTMIMGMLLSATLAAQGAIVLTTDAPAGTLVKILPNVASATTPLSIDWGNGVEMKYTVNPSQPAYNRWIEGTVEGSTITISGQVTYLSINEAQLTGVTISGMNQLDNLDLAHNDIEYFELQDYTPLNYLNLSYNKIYNSPSENPQLTLENAGANLTSLNLSYNEGLHCLDIRTLSNLEYLTLNDCPDFGSLFICMPEEAHTTLKDINIRNCDLAHFYPVSLPALTSLDLANNALMGAGDDYPFEMGDYPNLQNLTLSDNPGIRNLDVTSLKHLEKLLVANCGLSSIDVSQAPDLINLVISDNNISFLDLANNGNLTTLTIANNPIDELDVTQFPNISSLDISGTQIKVVNLMEAYFLKNFEAANTPLRFVDFNGQQPGRMAKVDLRNCPEFTYESMAYTVKTLPQSGRAWSTNLFLSGSNAEKSDIDYVTDLDMGWICDVQGDGSAQWNDLEVTLLNITDTGENKTGTVDRLYPLMGYSMPYDVDVMETEGGKFIICQWQKPYFQTIASVHDKAMNGVPIMIYPYPEEGKKFKSVTVNGQEIAQKWFIITEPSEIKVNFGAEESSIALTVPVGQEMSFLVNTGVNNGTVWVDWGSGARTPYPGQNAYESGYADIKGSRIDGVSSGTTVTIYGDVTALNAMGFGDVAADFGLWDNHITAADLSNAADLKYLNLYWNPVNSIDLSYCPNLEVLDLSYTDLSEIDLSHTPNLMWLEAYSDGSDGDSEGITPRTSIDLSNLPILQYINMKGNALTEIDLSHNPYLRWVDLNGNLLSSVDVSANPNIVELNLSRNNLTAIDLSSNTALQELNLDSNELTGVDVSNCSELQYLSVANNVIKSLDLHMLTQLNRLYINGNGMTADELNDLYYLLPVRDSSRDEEDSMQPSWNLAVIQGLDREENDGRRADSSIAEDREWIPSHLGSNGGSDTAYLDIIEVANGTISVADANGNIYGHGSKVPKYEPLTITAAPAEGYYLKGFTLNGESRDGSEFDMPGIYTKLMPVFAEGTGVASLFGEGIGVTTSHGQIIIKGDVEVEIYTVSGQTVATGHVNGARSFAVAPGLYIVRLNGQAITLNVK